MKAHEKCEAMKEHVLNVLHCKPMPYFTYQEAQFDVFCGFNLHELVLTFNHSQNI